MPMYLTTEKFPVAEKLGRIGINLPSYPDLTDSDIKFITDKIKEFYAKH
jgi:perosamine synthetase